MKVWLDDMRPMPQGFDIHVRTAAEAISLLAGGGVNMISLDHDLGDAVGTGYDVACYIEQAAHDGFPVPPEICIHSANPVGRSKMEQAIQNACSYRDRNSFWQCLKMLHPQSRMSSVQEKSGVNKCPFS